LFKREFRSASRLATKEQVRGAHGPIIITPSRDPTCPCNTLNLPVTWELRLSQSAHACDTYSYHRCALSLPSPSVCVQTFIPEVQRTSYESNQSAFPAPSYLTPTHLRGATDLQRFGQPSRPGSLTPSSQPRCLHSPTSPNTPHAHLTLTHSLIFLLQCRPYVQGATTNAFDRLIMWTGRIKRFSTHQVGCKRN
jgi:hypothetical protein